MGKSTSAHRAGAPTARERWVGQGSISLEYQTYTSAHLLDTLVTGMTASAMCSTSYIYSKDAGCLKSNNKMFKTNLQLRRLQGWILGGEVPPVPADLKFAAEIFVSCVIFSRKQCSFLHILQV